ncbi:MAG: ammonia-forming cytochrome c nitrite reductase subunit c552 [Candidatus Methanoperedens sp.]|nr:ammonia-forming cytochrome c nitrite reductase subunit c552 [Candidatus Methanoperedens sp.]
MRSVLFGRLLIVVIVLAGILMFIPEGTAIENSCVNCHKTLTPFIEEQKRFNQIRIQHLERNAMCSLECHEDKVRQLATANYQQWSESVHALKGVTCEACHGGDVTQTTKEKAHVDFKSNTDPLSPVYYTNVPETCGKCHQKELDNFKNSIHYQKLESLQLAPTCTTCHHPHTFTKPNPEDFRVSCGNCHSVYKKVAPIDIPLTAEDMIRKVNKLQFNIDMARQDIFWAEKNGTDVTQAKKYTENALNTLGSLAPMWHEFNMTHFEVTIDLANKEIKKAEDIVNPTTTTPSKTTTPEVPGFEGLVGFVSLMAVFYVVRKK